MISNHNLGALMGAPVQGNDGDKIGTVGQIFVDPDSGNPNWITVHTGLFGRHETFVPLDNATWDYEVLHVPFDKKTIKEAPRIDTDEALSSQHEADLYRYYRLGGEDDHAEHAEHAEHDHDHDHDHDEDRDRDERQDAPQDADATATQQQGPLRLRKYVVTEDKEVNVPVQREEVRVETEGDVHVNTDDVPDVEVTEQPRGRHAADE